MTFLKSKFSPYRIVSRIPSSKCIKSIYLKKLMVRFVEDKRTKICISQMDQLFLKIPWDNILFLYFFVYKELLLLLLLL
jgi:hypothetical protein